MSRELGKADLFITWTMNDNWADLQAAVQEGCRAGAVWPGQYPEGTRPSKPIQDGYDMEACVAFHKRVGIFQREFLAIGKIGPFGTAHDYWFRFEYQDRGRVHLHGVLWCPIPSRMMSSALQCPAKVMAMTRNSLHIYGVYTRSAMWCTTVTQTNVSTLAKGAYVPSASQGIRLPFSNIRRSWTVLVYAYCTAVRNKKMLAWRLTIVVF